MGSRVDFICQNFCERAHVINEKTSPTKFQKTKNINDLHAELKHPSEAIMQAMGNAMNLKLTRHVRIVLWKKSKMLE